MASARPVAVLDACVLVPRALRDLLLSGADTGVYRRVWEHEIEDEMIRNQVRLADPKGVGAVMTNVIGVGAQNGDEPDPAWRRSGS